MFQSLSSFIRSHRQSTSVQKRDKRRTRLFLERLENRLVPAQIWYVDGLGDSDSGQTNQGTLRYCMLKAADGDTIVFGVSGTIALNSSLPILNQKNLTINGRAYA